MVKVKRRYAFWLDVYRHDKLIGHIVKGDHWRIFTTSFQTHPSSTTYDHVDVALGAYIAILEQKTRHAMKPILNGPELVKSGKVKDLDDLAEEMQKAIREKSNELSNAKIERKKHQIGSLPPDDFLFFYYLLNMDEEMDFVRFSVVLALLQGIIK